MAVLKELPKERHKEGIPMLSETQLRRVLRENGYRLHKSRTHVPNIDNLGGYMITLGENDAVVDGSRFELDLDDVQDFVAERCS